MAWGGRYLISTQVRAGQQLRRRDGALVEVHEQHQLPRVGPRRVGVGVPGLRRGARVRDEAAELHNLRLVAAKRGAARVVGDGQLPDDVAHGRRQVERDGVAVLRAPDLREAGVRRGERLLEQALDLVPRVGPQRVSPVAVDERPERRVAPLRELARAVLGELARRLRARRDRWWWRATRELVRALPVSCLTITAAVDDGAAAAAALCCIGLVAQGAGVVRLWDDLARRHQLLLPVCF